MPEIDSDMGYPVTLRKAGEEHATILCGKCRKEAGSIGYAVFADYEADPEPCEACDNGFTLLELLA